MEEQKMPLENQCSFTGIRPVMVDLPYPKIQAERQNPARQSA